MLPNPKQTKDELVKWIRDYFAKNGEGCSAVIGISGGKDSSIAAALCVEALGKDRVVGVLMPNGEQYDIEDSYKLVNCLGIKYYVINIVDTYNAIYNTVLNSMGTISDQSKINLPPRIRMTTLYAVAQSLPHGGRVANTCNYSEKHIGFETKFGDAAGDFAPLAGLLMGEVVQIGDSLDSLKDIRELVHKTPADGLCGKTDEDAFGFSYADLDSCIEDPNSVSTETANKIQRLYKLNLHKSLPMPYFSPILSFED